MKFKGYTVHASKDEPQYLIKSDKTDHLAHAQELGPQETQQEQVMIRFTLW